MEKETEMKIIQRFLEETQTPEELANTTIAIDLDGVVHKYSRGFHDGTLYDPPMEGVQESLELLSRKYRLILFTARIYVQGAEAKVQVEEWLKKYDLLKYFAKITGEKEPCLKYIDDKALAFVNWTNAIQILKQQNLL